MNYYLLENHRVKLIDVDGKEYIGDVLWFKALMKHLKMKYVLILR